MTSDSRFLLTYSLTKENFYYVKKENLKNDVSGYLDINSDEELRDILNKKPKEIVIGYCVDSKNNDGKLINSDSVILDKELIREIYTLYKQNNDESSFDSVGTETVVNLNFKRKKNK